MDRKLLATFKGRSTAILAALLLSTAFSTQANTIKVHVLDANKLKPLKNVAVCLGTSANADQFGAVRTDSEGYVHFSELPKTPMVLTVSGSQHKGLQRVVSPTDSTLVRTVQLSRGGYGPVCDAPPTIIEIKPERKQPANRSLRIAAVNLDRGETTTKSRSVVLSPRVSGIPTHYRVSEDPSFKDAKWVDYQKTPLYTLSTGDGRKHVYYQVRKSVELDAGTIQTMSNVASDWITLESK